MNEVTKFLSTHEPRLTKWARAVFAASCVQRLMPVYLGYCARQEIAPLFEDWLDIAWNVLAGEVQVSQQELEEYNAEGLAELRGESAPGVQEAGMAVLHVLAELRGSGLAVQACSKTNFEQIGSYLWNKLGVPLDALWRHRLVEDEKKRQERDLEELIAMGEPGSQAKADVVAELRDRAQREGLAYLVP